MSTISGHASVYVPGVSLVIAGTADPSAGSGVPAALGTLYERDLSGATQLWQKTGTADTSWTMIAPAGSGSMLGASAIAQLTAPTGNAFPIPLFGALFNPWGTAIGSLPASMQLTITASTFVANVDGVWLVRFDFQISTGVASASSLWITTSSGMRDATFYIPASSPAGSHSFSSQVILHAGDSFSGSQEATAGQTPLSGSFPYMTITKIG